MRSILAIVLATCLLLSGCASKGGGGDKDDPTSSGTKTGTGAAGTGTGSSGTGSANGTGTGGPDGNAAPTGTVIASVNGTLVLFNLTGTDPDGDALSWTLDFGDGNGTEGSALPAQVNHTFSAGNYTAVYNVTDGKATATYNVTLNVTAGGGPRVILTGETSLASTPLTSDGLGAVGCAGFVAGENEQDCVFFELDAALAGRPYVATGTGTNLDLEFWEECDAASDSKIRGGTLDDADLASTVPADAGCVILWFYSAGSTGTVTVTVG